MGFSSQFRLSSHSSSSFGIEVDRCRLQLLSNGNEKDLLIADRGGGHQQTGESGYSGADSAPFAEATGLAIFWIVGHDYEERGGIGLRKSVAVRFRALRS